MTTAPASPPPGPDTLPDAATSATPGTPTGTPPSTAPGTEQFAPPPPQGAAPGGATSSSLWEQIQRLGVTRDRSAGWIGGVCAGLAHRLGVDPLLIRALMIVLTIAGGFGLVLYVMAWLLLPDTSGRILLREVARGDVTGILLVVLLSILLFSGISFGSGTWLGGWFVPVAALGIILLVANNRKADGHSAVPPTGPDGGAPLSGQPPATYPQVQAPPWAGAPSPVPSGPSTTYAAPLDSAPTHPGVGQGWGTATAPAIPPVPMATPAPPGAPVPYAPPRPQRRQAPKGSGSVVLGLAVLGYGLGLLLDGPAKFNGSGHFLGLLIALGVASLAALALGLSGRRGGMASVLALLLLGPVAVSAVVEKASLMAQESEAVTWLPTGPGGYNLGAGDATLDLSAILASSTGASTAPAVPASPAPAVTPSTSMSVGGEIAPGADPSVAPAPSGPAAPSDTPVGAEAPVVISASVGVGRLLVLVPPGVEVRAHSSVGLGKIDLGPFRQPGSGLIEGIGKDDTTFTTGTSAPTTIVDLRLNVGLGDLSFQEK